MKKLLIIAGIILLNAFPVQHTQAQISILEIIKAGVKKAIKAADLGIQRLQNKTVWMQNTQKVLENKMSELKLTEISDWANKQKELYVKYYDELWKVKDVIITYHSVKDIIAKQAQLVKECAKAFNLSKQDKNFTAAELNYMQQVYSGILNESLKNIDNIQLVINAFVTQMSDAKRLGIIQTAADNIEQNITDLRQFNQENIKVSLQRVRERNDIDVVKKLYGLQ